MLVSAVAGTRVLSTSIPGACASRGRASEGSPMVRYFAAAAVCVVCCLVALPRLSAQSRPAQPAVRRTAAQPQTARTAEASPAGRSRLADEPQTDGNAAVAGEATTDEGGRPASAGAVIEMKGKPAARRAPPMTAEQEQESAKTALERATTSGAQIAPAAAERIAASIARSDQAIARSRALFPACQDGQRSLALRFGGRAQGR